VQAVQSPLALGGQSGSDDPDQAVLWLREPDDDEPATDGPDRDESVLGFRVFRVEELEVVDAGFEEPPRLRERQPVLPLVEDVFGIVPLEVRARE